jgi:hypothetical protein
MHFDDRLDRNLGTTAFRVIKAVLLIRGEEDFVLMHG